MNKPFTVKDAAQHLGLTTEAVRQRVRRGALRSEKIDGTLFVFLSTSDCGSDDHATDDATGPNPDATNHQPQVDEAHRMLVEQLQRENERLWAELAKRDDELHRRDVLLREALEWRAAIAPQSSAMTTHTSHTSTPTQARSRRWWWPFSATEGSQA